MTLAVRSMDAWRDRVNSKELLVAEQYLLPAASLKGRKFQERKFEVENCSGRKEMLPFHKVDMPLSLSLGILDMPHPLPTPTPSPTHSNDDFSKLSHWHLHNYQCQD